LAACKTENKIEGKKSAPTLSSPEVQNKIKEEVVFDKKLEDTPQLVLPHAPHASILRSKLLLQLIERQFKSKELVKVAAEDEFKFNDSSDIRKQANLSRFQIKSETQARVIVSFSEAINAYLVPSNVPVKSLIDELHIQTEAERTLVWISPEEGVTRAGQVIYILSVNHEDLMEIDRMTYSEIINVNTKSHEQQLKLKYGQVAEIQLEFDYFVQMLQVQKFNGVTRRCKPEDMEAGSCDPCTYNREVPSSQFKVQAITSFNDLSFDVVLGGKKVELSDLSPKVVNNNLSIIISANNFSLEGDLDFRFVLSPRTFGVVTNGFNYGGACTQRNFSNTEILQSKAQSNMKVKVYGRGSLIKKIDLK